MSDYGLYDLLTPQYIFERVSQEQLMQKYIGFLPPLGEKFSSPFRSDTNPSCTLEMVGNKLVFRDWAFDTIYKDVFDLIQHKYKVSFSEALNMVANDFDLKNNSEIEVQTWEPKKKQKSRISVTVQTLQKENYYYLNLHGITPEIASRYNVFGVKRVFLNGKSIYAYSRTDPAIAYYFGLNSRGLEKWKIYFYNRTKQNKFLGNTMRINGYLQLPEQGKFVVITKAMKDIMTLARFHVPAIATQGESILPTAELIKELRGRFSRIFSLYDFDHAGQHTAWLLRRKYDITPVMLTDGSFSTHDYGSKDISDYVRDQGIDKAQQLINHALTYYTNEETTRIGNS